MKNLYQPERVSEIKSRIAKLQPTSERQWGKMDAPQMLAHCVVSMRTATGDLALKQMLLGRIIGGFVKKKVVSDDVPIRKNSPTAPSFVISDSRDLDVERKKLLELIDKFVVGGAPACTTNPHSFFGKMTPDEWAILMYKHLDHHLRQFGV